MMNIKIFLIMLTHHHCMGIFEPRQMPQPDISALKDDVGTLPLSDDFLPAVMQCLHYYTEMMQYEILQNPATIATPPTTRRPPQTISPTRGPPPTVTTTKRPQAPTITTRRTTLPVTITTTTTTKRRTTMTTPRPIVTTTTRKIISTTKKRKPLTTSTRTTRKPLTITTTRRFSTSKKPITKRTTTKYPYHTTTKNPNIHKPFNPQNDLTQRPHKPGVFAPEKPPYYIYFEIPLKPEQAYHKPGIQQPALDFNTISPPDWKDPSFVSWFFQPKPPRVIDELGENDLQYLDILPKKLLLDILHEPYHLPAINDLDNVNEFRKKYDDSYNRFYRKGTPDNQMLKMNMRLQMYQQRAMLTGKKKSPPTRPYVLMVMLYDQLKKEAKARKLHHFGGFTPELLDSLHLASQSTGVYQMKYLMESMLFRQEVADLSIIKRVNDILADLNNPKSDAFKALTLIPPLQFEP